MENKTFFSDNLKHLRTKYNMDQLELAERLGRKSSSSISEWEKGKYTPKAGVLNDISKIFNIPLSKLMNEDLSKSSSELETTELISKISSVSSKLEEHRQEHVLNFASNQLNQQNAEQRRKIKVEVIQDKNIVEEVPQLHAVEVYEDHALAAGLGFSYDNAGCTKTYYTLRSDLPRFDEAVPVTGNSMEPTLEDGDIALLKNNYSEIDGNIYAIDYDDKSYIKRLYFYNDKVLVRSDNPEYKDWEITYKDLADDEFTYFKVIGEVVDWFTPEVI